MKKRISIYVIIALVLSLLPTYVAANGTNSIIRVALMIDSGSALNTTRPFATLSSSTGLEITPIGNVGAYINHNSNLPIRLSLNQYRVLVEETQDIVYADSIVQRLAQGGHVAYILTYHRQNVAYYQVITGDEPSFESATSKLQMLKNQFSVGKEVLGPHAMTVGDYATEEEARTEMQAIVDAGYDASIGSYIDATGVTRYVTVVGNEGTNAELTSLYQEVILSFPNLVMSQLTDIPYVVKKHGIILSSGNAQSFAHYYTPVVNGVRIRPMPGNTTPTITLIDKENRRYRGEFELLSHRGKLAVVNKLGLEEYLYSVVGTEMASGWPLEALKAQAVIARTYALGKGNRYGIAHVSDTTYDQAYYGVGREAEDVRRAVNETAGIVLKYNGKLIEAYYYSNAGGMTAVGSEVWGTDIPYLRSVPSPDEIASLSSYNWYQVVRESGQIGYIRSDLVAFTGQKTAVGFDIVTVISDNTNLRSTPSTAKESLDKLMAGEKLTIINTVKENTSYSWIEGPIDGVTLMNMLNSRATSSGNIPQTQPIVDLRVESRGPSGRVITMTANGIPIKPSSPDGFRSIFGGLRSTLFEVEETGKFTILGANGQTVEYPKVNEPLTIISAGNKTTQPNAQVDSLLLYGNGQQTRLVTTYPAFVFHGKGYGHGFGLSQWGAKALAEQGYDYSRILKHYYSEQVTLQSIE